jgi:nucleoside-diphosphate-sugar epimerase
MNIAVTGANGQVGTRLLKRLQGGNIKVTGLVRRSSGLACDTVVTDWMHAEEATDAMASADTIIHLAGTLTPTAGDYEAANVGPTKRIIDSIRSPSAARVIYLSYVGASDRSANAYLRAKGRCEQLLNSAFSEVTTFRCTHIVGEPGQPGKTARTMIAAPGKAATVLGSGRQRVTPVFIGDVVEAIIRVIKQPEYDTFDLPGPKVWTMDEFVRMINRSDKQRIHHLPEWMAKLLTFVVPTLHRPLVEVMCNDSVGDPEAVTTAFGLELTDLAKQWS